MSSKHHETFIPRHSCQGSVVIPKLHQTTKAWDHRLSQSSKSNCGGDYNQWRYVPSLIGCASTLAIILSVLSIITGRYLLFEVRELRRELRGGIDREANPADLETRQFPLQDKAFAYVEKDIHQKRYRRSDLGPEVTDNPLQSHKKKKQQPTRTRHIHNHRRSNKKKKRRSNKHSIELGAENVFNINGSQISSQHRVEVLGNYSDNSMAHYSNLLGLNEMGDTQHVRRDTRHRRTKKTKAIHFTSSLEASTWRRAMDMKDNEFINLSHGLLTNQGYLPNRKKYEFWESNEPITNGSFADINQGEVTITRKGIYLIYIQVVYFDDSHTWAYALYVNDRRYAQCSASFPDYHQGATRSAAVHQCNLVVSVYLKARQRLTIKSLYERRRIISLGHHTFWGIVKL